MPYLFNGIYGSYSHIKCVRMAWHSSWGVIEQPGLLFLFWEAGPTFGRPTDESTLCVHHRSYVAYIASV